MTAPNETPRVQVRSWQKAGCNVVLVTGVFDLLHIEHVRFLAAAKAAGDKLVVGIETDLRVREIKGEGRPINLQPVRLEQLMALKSVDLAFSLPATFSTQTDWEDFMMTLKPDIYAVSAHSSYLENKRAICEKYGILFQVVRPHNPVYSTTKLVGSVAQFVKDN